MATRKEEIIAFISADQELLKAYKEAKQVSEQNGLSKAEYAKAISELLAKKNFVVSAEELIELVESKEAIELSDEALDNVAGGGFCSGCQ